jgi:hypothetical protein
VPSAAPQLSMPRGVAVTPAGSIFLEADGMIAVLVP